MTLLKEIEVNTLLERTIQEKRKYKPRNAKIHSVTKGKNKGPKYTFDEVTVLVYMTLFPEVKITTDKNITTISEVFNRSEGSISMTLANVKSVLFNTGKLTNASKNIKDSCDKWKNTSKNEFSAIVGNILKKYDYNIR
jgi:hypothetical protein